MISCSVLKLTDLVSLINSCQIIVNLLCFFSLKLVLKNSCTALTRGADLFNFNKPGVKPNQSLFALLAFFPRLLPTAYFPALGTVCTFSRAQHRLHVFPRSAPVARFPALDTGCTLSRAWHRLHIFPRLAPFAHFPALGTGCTFSRAWHRLHVVPRLTPVAFLVTCFINI